MAELTPYPLAALARRMFRELDVADAIFDLPRKKFFAGDPDRDLSVRFHGHLAGTPLGPAAGPQTQMAQNIVLSWLGGCRVMELKTVQILDRLEIPRPCIDMQTIGLNAEWSQELRLEQSLDEYVKAAMLIEMLRASGRVPEVAGFAPLILDMSVGYDLAGIRSDGVRAFVRGMRDATDHVERLRRELPAELGALRDLDFPTRLSDSITLSTFHGCPPEEIEGIIDHLLGEGIHCVVKFNPTLLGPARTRELLCERLGYERLHIPDRAFENDTKWDQAVAMMERLGRRAEDLGLGLGAKFSNTLILDTHRGFIPETVEEVYLSGTPLHVLAMTLVRRFRRTFGDRFPISFAAGIDRNNFPDAVRLGLVPITVCSDLLAPGGYGRLAGYHDQLARRMDAVGARTVDDFTVRSCADPLRVLDGAEPPAARREQVRQALASGGDLREAAGEELWGRWVAAARLACAEEYVGGLVDEPRYGVSRNSTPPRKIDSRLELFDCITCDKCIPVCPNDANFTFRPPLDEVPVEKAVRGDDTAWTRRREGAIALAQKHQIGNFADFCNECGNCDVFCPELGGPYILKPRFFGSEAAWRTSDLDGFWLEREGHRSTVLGRFEGREVRLERTRRGLTYSGEGFELTWDPDDPAGSIEGGGPDEVDLTWCHILDAVREGIFAPDRVNYLNVLAEDPPSGADPVP